jgi:hypothetical protein
LSVAALLLLLLLLGTVAASAAAATVVTTDLDDAAATTAALLLSSSGSLTPSSPPCGAEEEDEEEEDEIIIHCDLDALTTAGVSLQDQANVLYHACGGLRVVSVSNDNDIAAAAATTTTGIGEPAHVAAAAAAASSCCRSFTFDDDDDDNGSSGSAGGVANILDIGIWMDNDAHAAAGGDKSPRNEKVTISVRLRFFFSFMEQLFYFYINKTNNETGCFIIVKTETFRLSLVFSVRESITVKSGLS